MAMRATYKMSEAKEPAAVERASHFLGTGLSELCELWRQLAAACEVP